MLYSAVDINIMNMLFQDYYPVVSCKLAINLVNDR